MNSVIQTGIIQFYLKDRGFGYIRIPETGEEYHFAQKNLTEEIENKDEVEFEVKKTKKGFYAANIRKQE
ncbi:MAG: CspA family cold shock protein [Saprospiraceae bacterium]|jgi:CspA family cold shock protein